MNYKDRVTKAAVEAAISDGVANAIVCGSYTGDGQASRFIDLGFTPRAVLVMNNHGQTFYIIGSTEQYYFGGLCTPDSPVYDSPGNIVCEVVEGGFSVHWKFTSIGGWNHRISANTRDTEYVYAAVR